MGFPLRAAVMATLLPTLMLWPVATQPRPAWPVDMDGALGLRALAPLQPVYAGAPLRASIAIRPDPAFTETPTRMADLAGTCAACDTERFPYRAVRGLAFPIGTYGRTNHCMLTLKVGPIESEPLACESLQDNALATFRMQKTVPPGLYNLELSSTGTPNDAIAPYVRPGADDGLWVLAHSHRGSAAAYEAMTSWYASAPLAASAFGALALAAGLLFLLAPPTPAAWLGLVAALAAAVTLISPYFSGHDEGAHVTAMHVAATGASENDPAFNRIANRLMLDNDFFRLHDVPQLRSLDLCLHNVTYANACGVSARQTRLFRTYFKAASVFAHPATWSPKRMLAFGRAVNLALLAFLLVAVWAIYGAAMLPPAAAALVVAGAVWAQLATATNDFPNLALGVWLSVALAYAATHRFSGRSVAGIALSTAWLAWGRTTDANWVTGICPYLGLLVLSGLSRNRDTTGPHTVRTIAGWALGALAASVLLFSMPFLLRSAGMLNPDKWGEIADWSTQLSKLELVDFSSARWLLKWHLKSLFGSFVWGHSSYAPVIYALLGALTLGLGWFGLRETSVRRPPKAFAIGAIFGAVLSVQVATALAICVAWYSPDNPAVALALTKIRLSGPGLAAYFALPVAGVFALQKSATKDGIFRIVSLWSIVLMIHYLPRFFWLDRL